MVGSIWGAVMAEVLGFLQSTLIYVGSFVAVLSLVVFVHEFGHFQAARWSGVAVDTFSIGFGKTLWSGKDKHGVTWRVAALPLGGYVKFAGDADASSALPTEMPNTPDGLAEARKKGLFHAMPIPVRAFVVAAGPSTNFIFSILVFALLAFALGKDVTDRDSLLPRVDIVMADFPAAAAGIQPDDVILAVNGREISTWGEFRRPVEASAGVPLSLTLQRGEQVVEATVTPRADTRMDPETGIESQVGRVGIVRSPGPGEVIIDRLNPIEALGEGARQTWQIVASTGAYVGNIFTGKASAEHISGPTGIFQQSGAIAERAIDQGNTSIWERVSDLLLSLLGWAAVLSVAVGIVNLLPVPVLDGGHLAFYALEAVRGGKPLPMEAQEWAYRGGLGLLLCLFLFATWNDLQRLFG
jgi:regulator of sigma E protease